MARKVLQSNFVTPKLQPVNRTTISDNIVEQIMGLIERGELQPGQRLPSERELCVQFGTGRSSLREALRCLSIVGVLHARVGEGTSVAVDSGKFLGRILKWRLITEQQDIANLMEVRIALEGLTAASVARNVTAEDLQVLDSLLQKMAAAQKDQKRFTDLDLEFHLALAKASGNSLAMDLITMIRGQTARALSRVLTLPNARPLSLEEHITIVRKVRERDPEGASKAMDVHLRAALGRYRNTMNSETSVPIILKRASKSPPSGRASGQKAKGGRTATA